MFRLTREVRFAINGVDDPQLRGRPGNGYAGFPALVGYGPCLTLRVTLAGPLDPQSSYLVNIKQIDATVRRVAIPFVADCVAGAPPLTPALLTARLYQMLQAWPPLELAELRLGLSPFLAYCVRAPEISMVRLSQKFEFSATHRLHNPRLSEADNQNLFGKCNNPHGHGHNYELQVTLAGEPDENGVVVQIPELERIVGSTVIDRFDHKNLNVELPEFRELIPSVENIAMTAFRLLKPKFAGTRATLASVTVWETPKTWCEYAEE
jgi:6-pyruvoyltetrahydropterin/6-carboxytetrahydropterin synthase